MDGAVYGITEYTDPDRAIQDFMKISTGIFTGRVGSDQVATEQLLNDSKYQDDFALAIGQEGPLMVVWTPCHCSFLPQMN